MNILAIAESVIETIKNNPEIQEYAEPIAKAFLTGSSVISLPDGQLTISQSGTSAHFTIGKIIIALEELVLDASAPDSIQIGTTLLTYVPKLSSSAIPA